MGLSISDAIRILMRYIADKQWLPFEMKVLNTTARNAIAELEADKGERFASVAALMTDLHAAEARPKAVAALEKE